MQELGWNSPGKARTRQEEPGLTVSTPLAKPGIRQEEPDLVLSTC